MDSLSTSFLSDFIYTLNSIYLEKLFSFLIKRNKTSLLYDVIIQLQILFTETLVNLFRLTSILHLYFFVNYRPIKLSLIGYTKSLSQM